MVLKCERFANQSMNNLGRSMNIRSWSAPCSRLSLRSRFGPDILIFTFKHQFKKTQALPGGKLRPIYPSVSSCPTMAMRDDFVSFQPIILNAHFLRESRKANTIKWLPFRALLGMSIAKCEVCFARVLSN